MVGDKATVVVALEESEKPGTALCWSAQGSSATTEKSNAIEQLAGLAGTGNFISGAGGGSGGSIKVAAPTFEHLSLI